MVVKGMTQVPVFAFAGGAALNVVVPLSLQDFVECQRHAPYYEKVRVVGISARYQTLLSTSERGILNFYIDPLPDRLNFPTPALWRQLHYPSVGNNPLYQSSRTLNCKFTGTGEYKIGGSPQSRFEYSPTVGDASYRVYGTRYTLSEDGFPDTAPVWGSFGKSAGGSDVFPVLCINTSANLNGRVPETAVAQVGFIEIDATFVFEVNKTGNQVKMRINRIEDAPDIPDEVGPEVAGAEQQ